MFVPVRRLVFALLGSCVATAATAQPPASLEIAAPGVPISTVVAAVVAAHPELGAAEQRAAAAALRPPQEGSLPDPMVATGYTAVGSPLPGAGLGSDPNASLSVMVTQEFPYPGKRQLRSDVASREADAERQQVDAVRLNLVARAKLAYYGLASTYQLDEILGRNQELLATLVRVSESRYAVGQAAQQDVIRAQAEVNLLALQRERIAQQRRTREGELNALLNRAPGSAIGRPVDLAPAALSVTLTDLVRAADVASPMLARERAMVARGDAAIALARRDFKPDFALTGGYAFAGSMPDMYDVRFDVVVPWRKARRRAALAEQEHLRTAATQSLDASRLGLQGRLQTDFEMAATAGRLATLYRDTVLPQARLALESSLASYQTGAVDFLSVLTNFGSVLEYEMAYVEQLADLHAAAARLEEMAATTVLP